MYWFMGSLLLADFARGVEPGEAVARCGARSWWRRPMRRLPALNESTQARIDSRANFFFEPPPA